MTKFCGKPQEWNAINPASEKLKFGRGTAEGELKRDAGVKAQINGCPWKQDRTWLTIVRIYGG